MLWEKWRLVATLPKSIDWLLNSAPPYSSRVATRGGEVQDEPEEAIGPQEERSAYHKART